jgi:hypothetical protein
MLGTLIDSFEKLELAWHITNADKPLPEPELQRRAQLDEHGFRQAVDELVRSCVIVRSDSALALGPGAGTPGFESLMRLYTEDRLTVISELMSISIDRIRSMAARSFAEAFILRKKK